MTMLLQLGIVLGIMVLVHEFGHFAVAKLCGVRVELFSIGFGKRLFGFTRGGTDYRVSLLPLGGYVKFAGDIPGEAPTGDPGEFNAHPRWQRALIALAGPMANFILAFGLMLGLYMVHNEVDQYLQGPAVVDYVPANTPAAQAGLRVGDTIVHFDTTENPDWETIMARASLNLKQWVRFSYLHDGQRYNTQLLIAASDPSSDSFFDKIGLVPRSQQVSVQVNSLTPGFPAERAGLKPGDRIVSVDGLQLHSVPALIDYLQDQGGKPAHLIVARNGSDLPINLTPELTDTQEGGKGYRLGFTQMPVPSHIEKLPFDRAAAASWTFNKKNSMLIVEVVKRLFTRQVSVHSLAGPLGIGEQIHEAAQEGWNPLISAMAFISVNLGILNLMPFPILDGGMLAFLLIEGILRRDVNVAIKERVYQVAFVCLILFFVFICYQDLSRLSFFPHARP